MQTDCSGVKEGMPCQDAFVLRLSGQDPCVVMIYVLRSIYREFASICESFVIQYYTNIHMSCHPNNSFNRSEATTLKRILSWFDKIEGGVVSGGGGPLYYSRSPLIPSLRVSLTLISYRPYHKYTIYSTLKPDPRPRVHHNSAPPVHLNLI